MRIGVAGCRDAETKQLVLGVGRDNRRCAQAEDGNASCAQDRSGGALDFSPWDLLPGIYQRADRGRENLVGSGSRSVLTDDPDRLLAGRLIVARGGAADQVGLNSPKLLKPALRQKRRTVGSLTPEALAIVASVP
jgi:hypothetical protein